MCTILVIPVHSADSVELLNTEHLQKTNNCKTVDLSQKSKDVVHS